MQGVQNINILARDGPISEKFVRKSTDLQWEGCALRVSHAARCAVTDSGPFLFAIEKLSSVCRM